MVRRWSAAPAFFLLAILLAASSAWGQGNQGTLEGSVADPSGAAIAGAQLTVTNDATGLKFQTTTDSDGLFTFPVLPVGSYTVEVGHAGFSKLTRKDVKLTVGARLNLAFALSVAGQGESVTVTSETPLVETTRSQVSSTVDSQSVANLPVLGRNFINFVLLTPGVTLDRRDGDISFAGQRGTLNSLVVDGSDSNNTFFGQTSGRTGSGRAPYQFSQDAVAEFQVNSNSYSAELGHAGGAVINVITKSGSNSFHGTAFEFYRDTSLNAQDSLTKSQGKSKSPLHFNQFGGNLGGPVVKEKLFFFFDYDGQRNTLPNFAFLNLKGFVAAPPGSVIAGFENDALAYLTARAQPWTRTQNQDVYLGKADWHISQNHLLTGRINSQRFTGNNFENGGAQNSLEHTGASLVTTDTFSARLTSTFSSKLTNVASYTYLRDNEPGQANSSNPEATVRNAGVSGSVLVVGRNSFSPRFTNIHRNQWGDTVTLVQGRHVLKMGVDFIRDQIGNFFPGNFSGSYTFNSLESFGRSIDSKPQTATSVKDVTYVQAFAGPGTSGPATNPNLFETSVFLQDEWRFRRNLTLNLGVRYDLQRVDSPTTTNPAALPVGVNTGFIKNPGNGPEPRVGIAWTPMGDNRMVVRGGYGIFYGRTPSIMYGTAMSNNGLSVATFTFDSNTTLAPPQYPNTFCGPPGGPGTSPSCPAPSGGRSGAPIIFAFDPNYKQPMVQQWSLGIERELFHNLSLNLSYLGVHATHLQRTRDINLPTIGTADVLLGSSRIAVPRYGARPVSAFNRIEQFEGSANSIYHGLSVQLNKRLGQGFQFTTSYTWSHVIDDNPDATAVVPGTFDDAKMVQFPTLPGADRASGQNDQRHRFVVSGIWNLDSYTRGMSAAPRFLLGGWELSGIFTAQSGQPYSALIAGDLNNNGNSRTARYPGLGRDTFYLPRNISLDPRITKDLPLRENMKFQLILEAFNVFNRNNVFAVNTTQYAFSTSTKTCGVTPPFPAGVVGCLLPSATFGAQTTASNTPISPRIVQLGAKFIF
jgi:hypothetical protein